MNIYLPFPGEGSVYFQVELLVCLLSNLVNPTSLPMWSYQFTPPLATYEFPYPPLVCSAFFILALLVDVECSVFVLTCPMYPSVPEFFGIYNGDTKDTLFLRNK